jgi:hypothetical protein
MKISVAFFCGAGFFIFGFRPLNFDPRPVWAYNQLYVATAKPGFLALIRNLLEKKS